jgi:hypothetical protein
MRLTPQAASSDAVHYQAMPCFALQSNDLAGPSQADSGGTTDSLQREILAYHG